MTPRTAEDLTAQLERCLDAPVRLRLGRSRSAPVRGRQELDGWELHLHRAFLEADPQVLEALAAWLRVGRRARVASRRLDAFLEERIAAQPAPVPRSANALGAVHDLDALAAPIYAGFLADLPPDERPALTWGRRGASRSRHTIRLGSYDPARRLVRMHRVLDQEAVPAWFVTAVLVHELLHAALPPERDAAGRWIAHHARFRQREAAWPDHERARAWEKEHVGALIRSARTLAPLAASPTRKSRRRSRGEPNAPTREAYPASEPTEVKGSGGPWTWLQRTLFAEPN